MKRTILATCLAGACAVALSAQTPTQQPPPTSTAGTTGATTDQNTSASQRSRGGPMTITGCLKAGDTSGTYMLTNVKGMGRPSGTTGGETTGAGGTTAGATSTSPQGGQTRGMNEVMLTAASDVDLKPHVGHEIQVTGTPTRGQGAGAGATTTGEGTTTGAAGTATGGTAAGGATTATTGRGTPRNLNVTAVKMISDTCPQQ